MSERLTPIGSVAISGRPVLETTVSTSSGKRSSRQRSTRVVASIDSSSETDESRDAWIAIAPSSSVGTNSAPSREARLAAPTIAAAAIASTTHGRSSAPVSSGVNTRLTWRSSHVSSPLTPRPNTETESAGTSVNASASELSSANTTVNAMGRNILPSIPPRLRIGT